MARNLEKCILKTLNWSKILMDAVRLTVSFDIWILLSLTLEDINIEGSNSDVSLFNKHLAMLFNKNRLSDSEYSYSSTGAIFW